MFLMGIIGLTIRALSLIALYIISNPKKLRLLPPEGTDAANADHPALTATSKPLVNHSLPSNSASV